jgi:hypothetical protein
MSQSGLRDAIEQQYAGLASLVEKHGHAITFMQGYEDVPPAAFTTGGAVKGVPDLIISGMEMSTAQTIINSTFRLVEQRWPFPSMTRFSGIISSFDVVLRDVSKSNLLQRKMGLTAMFNRRNGLSDSPILQIYWPDPDGFYPFEPQCNPAYAQAQKLKGLYA